MLLIGFIFKSAKVAFLFSKSASHAFFVALHIQIPSLAIRVKVPSTIIIIRWSLVSSFGHGGSHVVGGLIVQACIVIIHHVVVHRVLHSFIHDIVCVIIQRVVEGDSIALVLDGRSRVTFVTLDGHQSHDGNDNDSRHTTCDNANGWPTATAIVLALFILRGINRGTCCADQFTGLIVGPDTISAFITALNVTPDKIAQVGFEVSAGGVLLLVQPLLCLSCQAFDIPFVFQVVTSRDLHVHQAELGFHRRDNLLPQGGRLRDVALGNVTTAQSLVVELSGHAIRDTTTRILNQSELNIVN
eukprot:m.105721 g.105721  ORF g.105721 m.105721 type:complete len:300 (-) comp15288_c1_seq2:1670-2569(-)